MKSLAILKAGSAMAEVRRRFGDFEEWLRQGLGLPDHLVRVVRVAEGESLPVPEECGGILITGSHAMVTEALPWSVALARWLPAVVAREIPLLAVCYGHQILAAAMGGRVDFHPQGPEIGTVAVELLAAAATDPLFSRLSPRFPVQAWHSQSVLTLPPGAVLLAKNNFEPHHAFRLGACAWGVQFHPEYTREIMAAELAADTGELQQQSMGRAALRDGLTETPAAAALLRRFAAIVQEGV